MHIEDPSHAEQLVTGLQDLYTVGLVTDVTLVAEQTHVPCHRAVLAACSPYFRAMFRAPDAPTEKVDLHNVSGLVLKPLIDYLYTSEITITPETVQGIFCASSLFELFELYDLCAEFMLKELKPSNCMSVHSIATTYENDFLKSVSRAFMMKHFKELVATKELYTLDKDEFLKIISNDDLDIANEELVFESVVQYVQHDFQTRKTMLPMLLKSVRIGLLTEDFMNNVMAKCQLIMEDPYCRSMMNLARLQVAACGSVGLLEEEAELEAPSQLKKRYGMHCTDLVVFISAGPETDRKGMGCYDPVTNKNYYTIAPQVGFSHVNRLDHHRATISQGNRIVVAGGVIFPDYDECQTADASSDVAYFDFDTKSWVDMPQMMERRAAHGLVSYHQYIYAIGGKSKYPHGEPLQTVEAFNTVLQRWDYMTDLPVSLSHHQTVLYNSNVYVIGGQTDDGLYSRSIYRYSPAENEWYKMDVHLEQPRAEFGAAMLGDELFVIGGWDGKLKLNTMEIINLATEKCRRGTPFAEDRKSPGVFVFHDQLYLCGGLRTVLMSKKRQKDVMSRDLWCYDSKDNTWTQHAKLVPYANTHAHVTSNINIKKLLETDFTSRM